MQTSPEDWYNCPVTLGVSLGPARNHELPKLALLSRDLVENGFSWTYTAGQLAHIRDRTDYELVVARNDTGPCGCSVMKLGFDAAHVNLLVVDVPFRRQGIASCLMGWMELMAKTAGVFDISLEVRASKVGAQAFYRQRGYRVIRRIHGFYGGVEDAMKMTADLRVRA